MSQYRVCGGQHFASTDTWDVAQLDHLRHT